MIKFVKGDPKCVVHSRFNTPGLCVEPNEMFQVSTVLASGSWLKSIEDTFDMEKDTGPNPTAVIRIEGATPGDTLAVTIHSIKPHALGYTGFHESYHKFPWRVSRLPWDYTTKTVKIEGDMNSVLHYCISLEME